MTEWVRELEIQWLRGSFGRSARTANLGSGQDKEA